MHRCLRRPSSCKSAEPAAARDTLGELLGEIELTQDENGAVWAQVAGFGGLILNMVAGVGFEPTTFGL